ncbi:hypothetical protein SRS16CHR_00241 [Variovorax sp. SRS16]|uniref:carboxypeptidase-like regulatory domain-containing protein n=1 Tax=Variovorax sp. SRS16 TaxID=282217 RepID=UPI0013197027|nr:carboxypeptidase-like regulatory domain-containing protein [Variovorax sp. SRS16]VTU13002.1 hypothetical protein SRS16CHR_00241 [Variovorax sp. SRS16]
MRASFQTFLLRGAVACACIAAPWAAQAQPAGMPAMRSQGAVQYVCGGIGSDESTAMRAAMKDHPLALLFARAGGEYLANVDVTVQDAKGGTALSMRASGPVCLIDLPAGRYTVQATSEGTTKSEAVTVGSGPKTADFRF